MPVVTSRGPQTSSSTEVTETYEQLDVGAGVLCRSNILSTAESSLQPHNDL